MTDPILLDVPTEIAAPRLRLRAPRPGDGALIFPTVRASLAELKPWMPWATDAYDAAGAEVWCRRAAVDFLARRQFQFLVFTAAAGGAGEHVGNVGVFALEWDVPKCEVGYWLATAHVGRGYMTEAVRAVTAFAADALGATRMLIRTDAANARSRRVAERSGFALEGTSRRCRREADGRLSDECVYAVVR